MDMSLEQVGFLVPIMALVIAVVMGVWALLVSVLALVIAVVMNLFGHHPKKNLGEGSCCDSLDSRFRQG